MDDRSREEEKKKEDDRRSIVGNGINDISRKEEMSLGFTFDDADGDGEAGRRVSEEADLLLGASDRLSIPDPQIYSEPHTPVFDRLRSSG